MSTAACLCFSSTRLCVRWGVYPYTQLFRIPAHRMCRRSCRGSKALNVIWCYIRLVFTYVWFFSSPRLYNRITFKSPFWGASHSCYKCPAFFGLKANYRLTAACHLPTFSSHTLPFCSFKIRVDIIRPFTLRSSSCSVSSRFSHHYFTIRRKVCLTGGKHLKICNVSCRIILLLRDDTCDVGPVVRHIMVTQNLFVHDRKHRWNYCLQC